MKLHWKVLLWMLAGVAVGLVFQGTLDAPAYAGAEWRSASPRGGIELASASGPAAKAKLTPGTVVRAVILHRGGEDEERVPLAAPADFDDVLARANNGDIVWLERADGDPVGVTLEMDPGSSRARVLQPFDFAADIFMRLLKMLIVPLVMTSIVTGVAGVGAMGDLRRLGIKTFLYYLGTSLLAILLGQTLVNLIRPGDGAALGLSPLTEGGPAPDESFVGVLKRMVPENIVAAMGAGEMLSMIFFALVLGFAITRTKEPHGPRLREFFEAAFEVMLRMAQAVLSLLPYGVFALMVRVVAKTGFGVFEPLLLYMLTVLLALLGHAMITLPLVIRFVGRFSPVRWFRAMSPALMTAFSTSSSSMTLPVTMETVEKQGRVSNKVTSFTLPLGATINMDGTALYECIGVIFLAQYYSTSGGDFDLTFAQQALVVVMALLASIGAAGIPSAGLVMMLTILSALNLPLEGAALLLAVDRPLDMLRTVVNVWSDSCGAGVIARTEGETGPLEAGEPEPDPLPG